MLVMDPDGSIDAIPMASEPEALAAHEGDGSPATIVQHARALGDEIRQDVAAELRSLLDAQMAALGEQLAAVGIAGPARGEGRAWSPA